MKKKLGQILNWIIFALWLWWAMWWSVRIFYPKPYPPLDKLMPLPMCLAILAAFFLEPLNKRTGQDEDDIKFFRLSIQILVLFPLIVSTIRFFLLR